MGVLLGGRLYVLLYQTEHLLKDPFMLFRVWEGGMASHGGFIGVILATLWYCKQSKQSFWPVADLIATVVPPGLFFGRIANFINGELWGIPSKLPWAVLFPSSPGFSEGIARHPSQIYAAFLKDSFYLATFNCAFGSLIFVKSPRQTWRGVSFDLANSQNFW